MKFKVTLRRYPAGIGIEGHDNVWELEGDSLSQAIDALYSRADFDPEWRVIHTEGYAQDGADQDGTIRAEAGADEHAESPAASGLLWRTRTE